MQLQHSAALPAGSFTATPAPSESCATTSGAQLEELQGVSGYRLEASPEKKFFNNVGQVLDWISGIPEFLKPARVITLPAGISDMKAEGVPEFIEGWKERATSASLDLADFPNPAAISLDASGELPVIYFLVSERKMNPPACLEGETSLYHACSTEGALSMMREGMYVLPGRLNFKLRNAGAAVMDDAVLVFRMPNSEIFIHNEASASPAAGLTFLNERMGARLPDHLRKAIEEGGPVGAGGFVRVFFNYIVPLRRRVLELGEQSGFLMCIPPSRIDIEATMRENLRRFRGGELPRESLLQLFAATQERMSPEMAKVMRRKLCHT